jgi:hypothetical protein
MLKYMLLKPRIIIFPALTIHRSLIRKNDNQKTLDILLRIR